MQRDRPRPAVPARRDLFDRQSARREFTRGPPFELGRRFMVETHRLHVHRDPPRLDLPLPTQTAKRLFQHERRDHRLVLGEVVPVDHVECPGIHVVQQHRPLPGGGDGDLVGPQLGDFRLDGIALAGLGPRCGPAGQARGDPAPRQQQQRHPARPHPWPLPCHRTLPGPSRKSPQRRFCPTRRGVTRHPALSPPAATGVPPFHTGCRWRAWVAAVTGDQCSRRSYRPPFGDTLLNKPHGRPAGFTAAPRVRLLHRGGESRRGRAGGRGAGRSRPPASVPAGATAW